MSLLGMAGDQWGFTVAAAFTLVGALFAVTAKRTFHSAMGLGMSLVGVGFVYIALGSPFAGIIQVLVYVGGILTLLVFAVMFVAGDERDEDFDAFTRKRRGAAPGWAHALIGGAVLLGMFLAGLWGAFYGLGGAIGDTAGGTGAQVLFVLGMLAGIVLFVVVAAIAWYVVYWLVFRAQMRVSGGIVLAGVLAAGLVGTVMDAPAWEESHALGVDGTASADSSSGLVQALFKDHVFTLEVLGVLLTAAMIGALVIARPLGSVDDSRHYATRSEGQIEAAMELSELDHKWAAPTALGVLRPAGAPPEGAELIPAPPAIPGDMVHTGGEEE